MTFSRERGASAVAGLIRAWATRTPVQTFVLCPLLVIAFELVWRRGELMFVPWGLALMAWGYLQYRRVGGFRLPRAGGSAGMDLMPDRIIRSGPYKFTRNPMYLGHLIYLLGLAWTFWSWFALVILVARAWWFHRRAVKDEERLRAQFGRDYEDYCRAVPRWLPWLV